MRFKIAAIYYDLHIAPGRLYNEEQEVLSVTVELERQIIISAVCPPESRILALMRELSAAWMMHVGKPSTTERLADLMGSILTQALTDLAINGGAEGIMRLRPGESPQAGAVKVALTRARQCALCASTVSGGSVVCEPTTTPGVLRLAIYCDHCNHVQEWKEMASPAGFPDGMVKGKPKFIKGKAVAAFLAANPEAAPGTVCQ